MERPALFVGDAEEGKATLNESEVIISVRDLCVCFALLCIAWEAHYTAWIVWTTPNYFLQDGRKCHLPLAAQSKYPALCARALLGITCDVGFIFWIMLSESQKTWHVPFVRVPLSSSSSSFPQVRTEIESYQLLYYVFCTVLSSLEHELLGTGPNHLWNVCN